MRSFHQTSFLGAAAAISVGYACSVDFLTPEEYFNNEGVASVHKVTVLRAYEGPDRETRYEVRNDETFKGCNKRPKLVSL